MAAFLNRISNWKTLLGLILLYLLFVGVLLNNAEKRINQFAGKEIGVIDLNVGFNPHRTLQMVADYSDEGRAYYKQAELLYDTPYPLIYTLLFAVIITLVYRRLLGGPVHYLNLWPFAAMLFDYAENVCVISMLGHYPEQSMAMAVLCEIFKLLKFLMVGVIIIVILTGLARLVLLRKVKAGSTKNT
jgi:hypothetical protein